jgi:AraC-like DNA-binding protein
MNISEVAYAVGFNDPRFFTRVFSEEFGMSPSALKKG